MTYNTTNLTAAENLYDMVFALNELEPLLGVFLIVSVFLVIFVVFKRTEQDIMEVVLIDSTITTIIAVLFWSIGLINWYMVILPIIGIFASGIIIKLR